MEVIAICTVSNPGHGKEKEVKFLVDTGSSRPIVTPEIAEELGLKTIGEWEFTIADRRMITLLPSIKPEEFIARMEGKLKSGNKTISPAQIKSIGRMQ